MLFRRVRAEFSDGVIDLLPLRLYPPEKEMGFGRVYDYMIVPHGTHREVGRISLRMGESPCVYYFGHIGYHVDPPYRGNHYARRACQNQLFKALRMVGSELNRHASAEGMRNHAAR